MCLGLCDLSWVPEFGKPFGVPGELIAQAVGGVAKALSKRSGPETGKVQVSGRWAQRVAYANF